MSAIPQGTKRSNAQVDDGAQSQEERIVKKARVQGEHTARRELVLYRQSTSEKGDDGNVEAYFVFDLDSTPEADVIVKKIIGLINDTNANVNLVLELVAKGIHPMRATDTHLLHTAPESEWPAIENAHRVFMSDLWKRIPLYYAELLTRPAEPDAEAEDTVCAQVAELFEDVKNMGHWKKPDVESVMDFVYCTRFVSFVGDDY